MKCKCIAAARGRYHAHEDDVLMYTMLTIILLFTCGVVGLSVFFLVRMFV
jgi:heme/copper-type cytochrome/quinol oxidase subunit 2